MSELPMVWRRIAADLNVASLRLGTHPVTRTLNTTAADTWTVAARQLEQALKEENNQ